MSYKYNDWERIFNPLERYGVLRKIDEQESKNNYLNIRKNLRTFIVSNIGDKHIYDMMASSLITSWDSDCHFVENGNMFIEIYDRERQLYFRNGKRGENNTWILNLPDSSHIFEKLMEEFIEEINDDHWRMETKRK